eukprot:4296831-Pyramimonas_sp.AAC.1
MIGCAQHGNGGEGPRRALRSRKQGTNPSCPETRRCETKSTLRDIATGALNHAFICATLPAGSMCDGPRARNQATMPSVTKN